MSVSTDPAQEFGPRETFQQLTSIKWEVPLNRGYYLYIGVPKCELDVETSRITLFSPSRTSHTVISSVINWANKLIEPKDGSQVPTRIKVCYKYIPTMWGDISPVPEIPEVYLGKSSRRQPNEAELKFAYHCADCIPQYDVTIRSTQRKKRFFGNAKVLVTTGSSISMPEDPFSKSPFLNWAGRTELGDKEEVPERACTMEELVSEEWIQKYNSGDIHLRPGAITFMDTKKRAVTGSFSMTDIVDFKTPDGVRYARKVYFRNDRGVPIVVVTCREGSETPIVELRVNKGLVRSYGAEEIMINFGDKSILPERVGMSTLALHVTGQMLTVLGLTLVGIFPPAGGVLIVVGVGSVALSEHVRRRYKNPRRVSSTAAENIQ